MAALTCAREPLRLRGAGLLPAAARGELRLQALHALHKSGAINEAEYKLAKEKLLAAAKV